MIFSRKDKDKDTAPEQGAAKKLGLSKVIYGLGMSARDALVTFVASTAVAFAFIYKGQKEGAQGGIINKLAELPDKVHKWVSEKFGNERAGKAGKALLVAASVGTVVSWVAHLPGLVRGPLKVKEAEATFNEEVDANVALHRENTRLMETLKHKDLRITELEKQKGTFVERVSSKEASPGSSISL